jgi:hypothetical protein
MTRDDVVLRRHDGSIAECREIRPSPIEGCSPGPPASTLGGRHRHGLLPCQFLDRDHQSFVDPLARSFELSMDNMRAVRKIRNGRTSWRIAETTIRSTRMGRRNIGRTRIVPTIVDRLTANVVVAAACLLVAGCGGGGGGSDSGDRAGRAPDRLPSGNAHLSGSGHWGAIADAEVVILGTDGVLVSGIRTNEDGFFERIPIPNRYRGPVRIELRATPTSTFRCDFPLGCLTSTTIVAFGEHARFGQTLAAVLPALDNNTVVHLNPFSHMAAERVRSLGGLSRSNIDQANHEVASLLRSLTRDASMAFQGSNFLQVPPIDLAALPNAWGGNDAAQHLALALLHVGFQYFATEPGFPYRFGDIIQFIADEFADRGSISETGFGAHASQMRMLTFALLTILDFEDHVDAQALDRYLGGVYKTNELYNGLWSRLDSIPTLTAPELTAFPWLDFYIGHPLALETTQRLVVSGGTGASLAPLQVRVVVTVPWLRIDAVDNGDPDSVELAVGIDAEAFEALPFHVRHSTFLRVEPVNRDLGPMFVRVRLERALPMAVDITAPAVGFEGETITLRATSNDPGATFAWTHYSGLAPSDMQGADSPVLTLTMPSLSNDDEITLRVTATSAGGGSTWAEVTIPVEHFRSLESARFADSTLKSCVAAALEASGNGHLGAIGHLACPGAGIGSLAGLEWLRNLRSLDLSNNEIDAFGEVLALPRLRSVDLRGNRDLLCYGRSAEIQATGNKL